MNAQKIIIFVAYFLTALLAVTAAKGYYTPDKRANDRPFVMGMRYGRAEKPIVKGGKHVVVAPRTDKFFLASRYGKRSSGDLKNPSLVYPVTPICGTDDELSCTYTGVSNLYHCIPSFGKDSTENTVLSASI